MSRDLRGYFREPSDMRRQGARAEAGKKNCPGEARLRLHVPSLILRKLDGKRHLDVRVRRNLTLSEFAQWLSSNYPVEASVLADHLSEHL